MLREADVVGLSQIDMQCGFAIVFGSGVRQLAKSEKNISRIIGIGGKEFITSHCDSFTFWCFSAICFVCLFVCLFSKNSSD